MLNLEKLLGGDRDMQLSSVGVSGFRVSRISGLISNEFNDLHRLSTFDAEESLRMPINFIGFGGQLYPLSYSRNAGRNGQPRIFAQTERRLSVAREIENLKNIGVTSNRLHDS